ncbi:MAG: DUF4065 domain-containing protein [Lachnospiraceae bacterium]|nr:DUF4065 domain-containing protein [Lachnospiraceae bacterium]
MYHVLDVCRHVINYSNEQDYGISNLKLQKILYFIQAFFLINSPKGEACFSEKIEAWDFGPVVPEAYHEYKQYGGGDIPTIDFYFKFDRKDPWSSEKIAYSDDQITEGDRRLMDEVVDRFADYTATDLVNLTHRQAPWKNVYVSNENREITVGAIRDYFNE